MGNGRPDVIDAAQQVVILAFDLVGTEIGRMPQQILRALQSPQVQDSIQKTLLDFARTRDKGSTTVVSEVEGRKLLEALGGGIKDAASAQVLDEVRKTPEYRRLASSVESFGKAAQSTALGVWIDKHKATLYVVGAALVVGGASALYITKTGGTVLNTALDPLKGKKFEVLQIGRLKIQAGLWDFQPDARVLGARVFGTVDWQSVSLTLNVGILAQGAEVKQAEGGAILKSGPFSVAMTAAAKPSAQQVNLGVKLGYEGVVGQGKLNIGIGAMYQDQQVSGTLAASLKTGSATVGLQGNIGPQKGGGTQYGGMLTLTIPLD